MAAELFIGIDVARDNLDVAVRPAVEQWRVANDTAGIAELLVRVRALRPTLIVLEATGGLELPLLGVLGSAGLPVVAVNPRQVRDFAKAMGKLAKTDALDAQVLAHFADAVRPAVRPLPDAATQALSALVARRRQLVEMLTAEENRRTSASAPIRADIQEHIAWLRKRLRDIEKELSQAYPSSGSLAASRSARSLAWLHSIVTAAPSAASVASGADAVRCGRRCIWQLWWVLDRIQF